MTNKRHKETQRTQNDTKTEPKTTQRNLQKNKNMPKTPKTARNAVKRCKRSGREAKLLVCNRSVSHGCGRSQSAGTVTAQTITWQTCGFVKRFDEPCAFPGKVKGQHRCGRMSCSHISGMLRAVTCDEGAWSPELPETAPWLHAQDAGLCSGLLAAVSWSFVFWSSIMFLFFWLFVIFLAVVCWFLAVFGPFMFVSFYFVAVF